MKTRRRRVSFEEERTILAEEQTILSKERTILSFMRTGLAFIGTGLVIINIFPSSTPTQIIGWLLVLIGFAEIAESYRRLKVYKRKMERVRQELGKNV